MTDREARSRRTSQGLLAHAVQLVEEVEAAALFVYADALPRDSWQIPEGLGRRLMLVTRGDPPPEPSDEGPVLPEEPPEPAPEVEGPTVLPVPAVRLTRMGQVKMAVLLALSRGLLRRGDRIVCLTGIAQSGALDMLFVTEVGREFEMFLAPSPGEAVAPTIQPEVFSRVLDIALALGGEGREGKPVGTLFVVGDSERVTPLTRQLILNPFYGYPEAERNVLDDRLRETLKELATVDGAFVIRGDGVILSAASYLKTSALPEEKLPAGLGARHQAAAGITFVTDSIAIVVSESTGVVSVFRSGRVLTELEPARGPSPR